MNYIKQVLGEIRQQPLAVWLSVGGTALSIFLVMAVFIVSELPMAEAKPESCRKSLMIGEGIDIEEEEMSSSSTSMSKKWADNFYGNLKGIEKMSYFSNWLNNEDISVPGQLSHPMTVREADNAYWDIFDFDFVEGKPYSKAEFEANMKVAVINEKTARLLFKTTKNVVGKEFQLKQMPYRVVGVIKNVNPLFTLASGDVYIPINIEPNSSGGTWMSEYMGKLQVLLLKKPGVSDESIKKQVKARYQALSAKLKKENRGITYHETPYNMEYFSTLHGSNTTPDPAPERRKRWIIYTILLLVPAINLSGMSRSRLRRRVSEIGVRRAFGATRLGVVGQLLGENLIITILGGIIGLIFCIVFIMLFSNLFVNMTNSWRPTDDMTAATPVFSMIFTWKAFGFAILFCFFLNLLSAGIPVWRATSINPAEAISGNENFKR